MGDRISYSDAEAFRARWKIVNEAEIGELRAATPIQKLRQLEALMVSVPQMGWANALQAEEGVVRDRWNRLRRVMCAR